MSDDLFTLFARSLLRFNIDSNGNLTAGNFENQTIVRSPTDIAEPVNGVISVPAGQYVQVKNITTDIELAFPDDVSARINWTAINRAKWIYDGTGACFNDLTAKGSFNTFGFCEFQSPNGKMWNILSDGFCEFQAAFGPKFSNVKDLGDFSGVDAQFNLFFGTVDDFDDGLYCNDVEFFEVSNMFVFPRDNSNAINCFEIDGSPGAINFILPTTSPNTNQFFVKLNRVIAGTSPLVLMDRIQVFSPLVGDIFNPDGLDQTDPVVVATGGSLVVPDSTVDAGTAYLNNALVTTITTQNTPTEINTLWDAARVPERVCYRDLLTFNGTTDVCTTTFNHGLLNGAIITLTADGGLPTGLAAATEYFIINKTATTFQLSLTSGGAAIDFTGNGTAPNYYEHLTGNSSTGWSVFIGLSPIKVRVSGFVSMQGATVDARAVVMKTDTSFVETVLARASTANIQNVKGQSSIVNHVETLTTGEGIKIFIENLDSTANMVSADGNIIYQKI